MQSAGSTTELQETRGPQTTHLCLSNGSVLDTCALQNRPMQDKEILWYQKRQYPLSQPDTPRQRDHRMPNTWLKNPATTISLMSGNSPEPFKFQVNSHQFNYSHRVRMNEQGKGFLGSAQGALSSLPLADICAAPHAFLHVGSCQIARLLESAMVKVALK